MFASNRPGGLGANDLYIARRRNQRDDFDWDSPESLGSGVNSSSNEVTPVSFESDNTGNFTLYFASNRPGGPGGNDIYASVLARNGTFDPPVLVPELSSSDTEGFPTPRRDGLELFLTSSRTGTLGENDLWVSTRLSTSDPWSPPVNFGASINTTAGDSGTALSSNATSLIFYSDRPGGSGLADLYEIKRAKVPVPTAECTLTGTPAISAVVNSGSFQAAVAPNSMVSIFGLGFAPQGFSRAVGRDGAVAR